MAISLEDKLLPYTIHVSSGHYFQVFAPFEFVHDFWAEIKKQKKSKDGEIECICLNVVKKAFYRFVDPMHILSVDDDQERVVTSLEEMIMDAKDIRTRNAQKKAKKVIKDAKNKLSQKAKERSF